MDEEASDQFTVRMPTKPENSKEESKRDERCKKDEKSIDRKDRKANDRRSSDRHDRTDKRTDKDDKLNDEKRKWKVKFEQIQTQLSRTEIQMYDYKLKLNDLVKENTNLRENLEMKIVRLEASLTSKSADYSRLKDAYDKLRLTDQSNLIDFNESSNETSSNQPNKSSEHNESSNDSSKSTELITNAIEPAAGQPNDQNHSDNLLTAGDLVEANRQLLEINEQLRNEIQSLEIELEESSDRYREEQTNEFKEMKFKLESCVKNSRLLQFKLTKLERAYNQMKVENHHLTNKLKKATELNNLRNRPSTPQTEITKTELDRAKEVLLRMHVSLQTEKGEKIRLESTIKRLEEQLNITKSELIAVSLRSQNQLKNQLASQLQQKSRALSPQTSIDRQLEEKVRDLEERESDLQEQLKFSEQQSNSLRKKLSVIEQENEILTKQFATLCSSDKSNKNDANSIENMVVLKVEQDEQLVQLRKELDEQKKQNQELERKLGQLQAIDDELIDSREFIKRGSTGELIRKGSGEIIRRDSGAGDLRRDSLGKSDDHKSEEAAEDGTKLTKSISNSSLNTFNNPKVEKVLQKENYQFSSLFYEEKIEHLERQLQKIKGDLNEKQQENENLMNLIELKRKDKLGKRFTFTRSSSLQD